MKKVIKRISGWYFGGFRRKRITLIQFLRLLLWGGCLFFFTSFLHAFWFRIRFPGRLPEFLLILLGGVVLPAVVRFAWNLPEPEKGEPDRLFAVSAGLNAGLLADLLLVPFFLKWTVSHPLILLCCSAPAPAAAAVLFLRHPPRTGNGLKAPVTFLLLELISVFYFFFWVKVTGLRLSSPGI